MSTTSFILFILIVCVLFLMTSTGVGIRNDSLIFDLSAQPVPRKSAVRNSDNVVNVRLSAIEVCFCKDNEKRLTWNGTGNK